MRLYYWFFSQPKNNKNIDKNNKVLFFWGLPKFPKIQVEIWGLIFFQVVQVETLFLDLQNYQNYEFFFQVVQVETHVGGCFWYDFVWV